MGNTFQNNQPWLWLLRFLDVQEKDVEQEEWRPGFPTDLDMGGLHWQTKGSPMLNHRVFVSWWSRIYSLPSSWIARLYHYIWWKLVWLWLRGMTRKFLPLPCPLCNLGQVALLEIRIIIPCLSTSRVVFEDLKRWYVEL